MPRALVRSCVRSCVSVAFWRVGRTRSVSPRGGGGRGWRQKRVAGHHRRHRDAQHIYYNISSKPKCKRRHSNASLFLSASLRVIQIYGLMKCAASDRKSHISASPIRPHQAHHRRTLSCVSRSHHSALKRTSSHFTHCAAQHEPDQYMRCVARCANTPADDTRDY